MFNKNKKKTVSDYFNEVFKFVNEENLSAQQTAHPEKQPVYRVYLIPADYNESAGLMVLIYPFGTMYNAEPHASIYMDSKKEFADVYSKHKLCGEVHISKVISEIQEIVKELRMED